MAGIARAAARAMRRARRGGDADAEAPQAFKGGRARWGTHRTGFILAVLRRRGGLGGGTRFHSFWIKLDWQRDDLLYPQTRVER